MYRCMTCDDRKRGEPTLVELNDEGEAVGLCPKCTVIVRSFNTLRALAASEYGAERKVGATICCDDPDCPEREDK